jgi:long-subunit acyl-CoA synthetase (AMP-forming)
LSHLACFAAGIIVTTAYDSMPADDVLHVLKETGAKVVLTEVSHEQIDSKKKKLYYIYKDNNLTPLFAFPTLGTILK